MLRTARGFSFLLAAICAGLLFMPRAQAQGLTAASDVGLPPYAMTSDSGEFIGIDMDIAKALSHEIGTPIKVIDQPWSTTFPGLNAGKFDIVLSSGTVTKERSEAMLYIEPYGDVAVGFIQRANTPTINTIEDLRGKTIAVNQGNLYDRWLTQHASEYDWKVARFGKSTDGVAAVASGQADAVMLSLVASAWIAKETPKLKLAGYVSRTGEVYAYSVRLGQEDLRKRLDIGMECLKKKGELAAIFKKWTGLDPAADSATRVIMAGYGVQGFANYDPTPHDLACPK